MLLGISAAPASAQPLHCGQVITRSTTLDRDLDCATIGDTPALTIGANRVTLDLAGHTITGPDSTPESGLHTGVAVNGRRSVTVENGRIEDFYNAFDVRHAKRIDLHGLSLGLSRVFIVNSDQSLGRDSRVGGQIDVGGT